ncbi:MAG TPA: hypothetical protein VEQ85_14775 [Lacipirellulaceae bacterium]|nr:hypothetical protein [Lacipirellulaceae bacterium]
MSLPAAAGRIALLLGAVVGAAAGDLSFGQAVAVQPASAEAPLSATPGPRVKFQQRETAAGDRVVQRLGMHLSVETKIVQSGQIAHQSTSDIRSQQQRTIDVLEVTEGRAARARVSFQTARRLTPDSEPSATQRPASGLAGAAADDLPRLPTEGKAYLLARDGEQLSVTDPQGAIPPQAEFVLVAEAMEGLGKPNPLALVLAGREVAVGQRLFVPREMAKSLLGLGGPELASVHRFELTLDRLAPPATRGAEALAVFKVTIEVRPEDAGELAVILHGEMAVEPTGCRLTAVDLAGPVHVSTIERTELGIYQYTMDGDLRVAIRSAYGAAN